MTKSNTKEVATTTTQEVVKVSREDKAKAKAKALQVHQKKYTEEFFTKEGLVQVSAKIRFLNKEGLSRMEIATLLNKRYQHVRNVLVEDERLAANAE